MIKIEHGVKKLPNDNYTYQYDYWTVVGLDELDETINRSVLHTVVFTIQPGQVPEIGDFIEGNTLVKRVGYQVTEGRMKWPVDQGFHENGWDADHEPDGGWDKWRGQK